MREPAIEAIGIAKAYGAQQVLGGVDLRVERGTVFSLLGPNGAGKTTMVRILATLLRADAGRARVAGFDVVEEQRAVRRAISLTGQYAAVDELQTGEENLRMMGRLAGLGRGHLDGGGDDPLEVEAGLRALARALPYAPRLLDAGRQPGFGVVVHLLLQRNRVCPTLYCV